MQTEKKERAPRIAALTLGTVAGLAVGTEGAMLSRSIDLSSRAKGDTPTLRLFAVLDDLARHYRPDIVALPAVPVRRYKKRKPKPDPLESAVADWACRIGADLVHLVFGEVKKSFTGNGNASSTLVTCEAESRGFKPSHAAEAMAIACFECAVNSV